VTVEIDDAKVEEFRALYKSVYNESISADHAREIVQRFITLYCLLLRPLPSEAPNGLQDGSSKAEFLVNPTSRRCSGKDLIQRAMAETAGSG
jgi:hypothetical protein